MYAVKKFDSFVNGVNKQDVELSLESILDQLRKIDQKLGIKVENDINAKFQHQQQEILATEAIVISLNINS